MMTITYEYEGALYVNLTNRCDCNCVFCLRHNGHKGSIYADDLWLEHEPSREEALADFRARTWPPTGKSCSAALGSQPTASAISAPL